MTNNLLIEAVPAQRGLKLPSQNFEARDLIDPVDWIKWHDYYPISRGEGTFVTDRERPEGN